MAASTALYRDKVTLRARLGEVPARPGIYRFYNPGGTLIYVGKSVCLRDRVRSYFTGKADSGKVRRLRQEVSALDWEETGSELEALLLESRLIKYHQPRFNVMLREFVPLPCVRVDFQDPYPRLQVTRSPARDGATYFGPFRSQATLEAAVAALENGLRLRDCEIDGARIARQRPCYRYELGTCSAPCLGKITPEEYAQSVRSACAVFEGQGQGAVQTLRLRMEQAAERLQFELAARLRDAVQHIQAVTGRQQALLSAVRELSLVAACPAVRTDSLLLLVFRSGRLVLQEEAVRVELCDPVRRNTWASRLMAAKPPPVETGSTRLDATVMDEIQIITSWMKQRTREGDCWQFDGERPDELLAIELDTWLASQARLEPIEKAA